MERPAERISGVLLLSLIHGAATRTGTVRARKHKRIHGDSGDKVGKKRIAKEKLSDDFVSVARRLEADEDKATFEAKLAKIAKARSSSVK